MAVLAITEVELSPEQYDQVNEKMGITGDPPKGLITHTAEDLGGGKLRVVDVWESPEALAAFAQERLGPAATEVMGGDNPPTTPEFRELHNVFVP